MGAVSAWLTAFPAANFGEILGSTGAFLAAIGFGGVVGAWISARKDLEHQQREIEQQMRARMLGAADNYIGAASAALSELRALDPTERKQQLGRWERLILGTVRVEPTHTVDGITPESLDRVKVALDEANRHLTRLALIFGPNSAAATAAEAAVTKTPRHGYVVR